MLYTNISKEADYQQTYVVLDKTVNNNLNCIKDKIKKIKTG